MKRALWRILISMTALAFLPGCLGAVGNSAMKRQNEKEIEATKKRRELAKGLDNDRDDPFTNSPLSMSTSIDKDTATLEKRLRVEEQRLNEYRAHMSEMREHLVVQEELVNKTRKELEAYRAVQARVNRQGDTILFDPSAPRGSYFDEVQLAPNSRRDDFAEMFPGVSRQPTSPVWKSSTDENTFTPDMNMTPRTPAGGSGTRSGIPGPTSMGPSSSTFRPERGF